MPIQLDCELLYQTVSLQVITDAGLVTVYPLQAEDERGTAILMTRSLNKGHRFAEMRCCMRNVVVSTA